MELEWSKNQKHKLQYS